MLSSLNDFTLLKQSKIFLSHASLDESHSWKDVHLEPAQCEWLALNMTHVCVKVLACQKILLPALCQKQSLTLSCFFSPQSYPEVLGELFLRLSLQSVFTMKKEHFSHTSTFFGFNYLFINTHNNLIFLIHVAQILTWTRHSIRLTLFMSV